MAEKKTAIAFCIAFVADDSETTAERRFQRLPVSTLHCEREASLLSVLLPLVDGVRDGNALDNFGWLASPRSILVTRSERSHHSAYSLSVGRPPCNGDDEGP